MNDTHDTAVPGLDRRSFWERDEVLRRAAERVLGREEFARQQPTLAAIGAAAADEIDRCAAVADRARPELVHRDPAGNRIDAIDYHPAYRRLEDLAYREFRLVGCKYDPELRSRGVAHRVGFLRTLVFGMGEQGVLCPVCMTDGVARVLEHSGDEALAREIVPRLCFGAAPGDPRGTGAMFLTEKAGGSDVGRVETVARRDGARGDGRWLLSGEKWFSSNVDAEYVLALARPEGAAGGTRGLGMFLVERAAQTGETFRIERLKDKLGTRSMPTGEVVLRDAPARQVGELSSGFKQMTGMLNLSRLYNAVVSCSAIGRAWLEARSFAERRVTFGKPVIEHPLAQEALAEMEAEHAGALALVLEATRALDDEDGGDAAAAARVRALTPLIKLFTAKVAVSCASEGLEFLGGCGYVEDWPLARVLRDAQVLPVWEGTTNILALDLVRIATKGVGAAVAAAGRAGGEDRGRGGGAGRSRGASATDAAGRTPGGAGRGAGRDGGAAGGLAPLLERARQALAGSTAPELAEARDASAARLGEAEQGFARIAAGEPPRRARALAFTLARGVQVALLAEAAEPQPDGPEGRAARRLALLTRGPCL